MAQTVIINAPGPQGPVGPQGPQGPPGSPGDFDPSALVTTSSFNSFTSSYNTDSASFSNRINNVTIDTSSLVTTSSFYTFTSSYKSDSSSFNTKIVNLISATGSYVLTTQTSSFVTVLQTSSFVTTSSFNNFTSSYNTGSFTGSYTGSLFGTSSWASNYSETDPIFVAKSGSYTTTSSFNNFTSSYNTDSSSFNSRILDLVNTTSSLVFTASYNVFSGSVNSNLSLLSNETASYATTGSNVFKASQTITGSLTITNDLVVLGSSSITYVSQSTLNIGTNLITVNANNPTTRFGGLAVIDSGSSPQKSGSILFDSQNNQWIFVHESSGGSVTSSVFIQGPQTFDDLGNETTLTTNRIPKATGGDLGEHIGDSNITDNGTIVSINSNTQVTGSLNVTLGITGSLFGTSSWTYNYNETDPIFTAKESTLVTTASFNSFTASYNTGSFSGSFIGTASWAYSASQAITASYISPTFISASAAASGFGSGGGGSTTLIDTIGFRIYTDDTYITSGLKAYKHIGYNSTITKTRSIANTNGYIDINVKRNGSTLGTISLSNQSSSLDTTLTGWTTTLNTDDLLEFHVSQSSTYITDISIFIDIQSQ